MEEEGGKRIEGNGGGESSGNWGGRGKRRKIGIKPGVLLFGNRKGGKSVDVYRE